MTLDLGVVGSSPTPGVEIRSESGFPAKPTPRGKAAASGHEFCPGSKSRGLPFQSGPHSYCSQVDGVDGVDATRTLNPGVISSL